MAALGWVPVSAAPFGLLHQPGHGKIINSHCPPCQSCTSLLPWPLCFKHRQENKVPPPPVRQNEKKLPKTKMNKKENSFKLCFSLTEPNGPTGIKLSQLRAQPPCSPSPCPGTAALPQNLVLFYRVAGRQSWVFLSVPLNTTEPNSCHYSPAIHIYMH